MKLYYYLDVNVNRCIPRYRQWNQQIRTEFRVWGVHNMRFPLEDSFSKDNNSFDDGSVVSRNVNLHLILKKCFRRIFIYIEYVVLQILSLLRSSQSQSAT